MKYRTIVADPPWAYRTKDGITTNGRGANKPTAAQQYPTMSVDEVAAMPVREQVDDNAHLYLWVTNPLMFDAFRVVEAWGFRYVTTLTWLKTGPLGMGFYFRGETEHVLFGVRGAAPIPADRRERNWISCPKTGHSRKPDRFYEIVERVSSEPRLELFARRRRYGWDVWGDQAPTEQASQATLGIEGVA